MLYFVCLGGKLKVSLYLLSVVFLICHVSSVLLFGIVQFYGETNRFELLMKVLTKPPSDSVVDAEFFVDFQVCSFVCCAVSFRFPSVA